MSTTPDQALIILNDARARAGLAPHVNVTQMGSERVLVVRADRASLARVGQLPGVTRVITPGDTAGELPALNASESLFVQAWIAGQHPKQRKGEGAAWDAPGFTPPDRPRT